MGLHLMIILGDACGMKEPIHRSLSASCLWRRWAKAGNSTTLGKESVFMMPDMREWRNWQTHQT